MTYGPFFLGERVTLSGEAVLLDASFLLGEAALFGEAALLCEATFRGEVALRGEASLRVEAVRVISTEDEGVGWRCRVQDSYNERI